MQDYVEFIFDGPIVRAVNGRRGVQGGATFEFPRAGSGDALCAFIGLPMIDINIDEAQSIRMVF